MLATLVLCALALAGGWAAPDQLRRLTTGGGARAAATFAAGMLVAELLWLPRVWGLLAAGALFGPWRGALLAGTADLLCATICYFAARTAGRPFAAAMLARRPNLARWVTVLAEERGHWTMLALRVGPVHFTALSYAAGVSGVRPAPYFLGTALGMLPGGALYPWLGHAARQPSRWMLLGLATLAIALGGVAFWIARRLVSRRPDSQPERHLVGQPQTSPSGTDAVRLDAQEPDLGQLG